MIIVYFSLLWNNYTFSFFSERNDVLREAEILHKARFSYILPILGICNEPEFLGIVTEYMPNGSLNELLHRVSIVHFQKLWFYFCSYLVFWFYRWPNCLERYRWVKIRIMENNDSGKVTQFMASFVLLKIP